MGDVNAQPPDIRPVLEVLVTASSDTDAKEKFAAAYNLAKDKKHFPFTSYKILEVVIPLGNHSEVLWMDAFFSDTP